MSPHERWHPESEVPPPLPPIPKAAAVPREAADRVPLDVLRRLQDEQTPTDPCAPHCHQGAVLDGFREELAELRLTLSESHRGLLEGLSGVKGELRDLRLMIDRALFAAVDTANTTSRVAAVSMEQAAHRAPRTSTPPSGRGMSKAMRNTLAGLGIILASGVATMATRCTEAHVRSTERPLPQEQAGP